MLNQQTISILHSLKLVGLASSFEGRLADPRQSELSHAEFVGLLVQDEKTYRDNLRLRRLLKKAKLRQEPHWKTSITELPGDSVSKSFWN